MLTSLVWLCPGDMAAGCRGKVGDVLVAQAVARHLARQGHSSHLVTNPLMAPRLRRSCAEMTVGQTLHQGQRSRLSEADLATSQCAKGVVVLRPDGDREADAWTRQLTKEAGLSPSRIWRVGDLDGFSPRGPHMALQILNRVEEHVGLQHSRALPASLYPVLDLLVEGRANRAGERPRILVLPFAGGRLKWLPTELVIGVLRSLDGQAIIASGPLGEERAGLDQMTAELSAAGVTAQALCGEMEHTAAVAARCDRVLAADGGLSWATVAGLNWLAERGELPRAAYPQVTVVFGHPRGIDPAQCAPAAAWEPLSIYPERVRVVNGNQRLAWSQMEAAMVM